MTLAVDLGRKATKQSLIDVSINKIAGSCKEMRRVRKRGKMVRRVRKRGKMVREK